MKEVIRLDTSIRWYDKMKGSATPDLIWNPEREYLRSGQVVEHVVSS